MTLRLALVAMVVALAVSMIVLRRRDQRVIRAQQAQLAELRATVERMHEVARLATIAMTPPHANTPPIHPLASSPQSRDPRRRTSAADPRRRRFKVIDGGLSGLGGLLYGGWSVLNRANPSTSAVALALTALVALGPAASLLPTTPAPLPEVDQVPGQAALGDAPPAIECPPTRSMAVVEPTPSPTPEPEPTPTPSAIHPLMSMPTPSPTPTTTPSASPSKPATPPGHEHGDRGVKDRSRWHHDDEDDHPGRWDDDWDHGHGPGKHDHGHDHGKGRWNKGDHSGHGRGHGRGW